MKIKINEELCKKLKFFGKILYYLATITIAGISVFVIMKTNEITNTANLIQINDDIQRRTDILFTADLNKKEYLFLSFTALQNGESIDEDRGELLDYVYDAAITSLLNTYEFACSQYLENKIDKEAFKGYYFELVRYIRTKPEYISYFGLRDGREPYQAINQVYKEWHGK